MEGACTPSSLQRLSRPAPAAPLSSFGAGGARDDREATDSMKARSSRMPERSCTCGCRGDERVSGRRPCSGRAQATGSLGVFR